MSSAEDTFEEEIPILDEFGNKIYEPYMKKSIYLYIVNDFTFFGKEQIPQQLSKVIRTNPEQMYYEPIMVLTDFWSYKTNTIQLNNTVNETLVELVVKPQTFTKITLLESMDYSNSLYAQWGLSQDMDQMK